MNAWTSVLVACTDSERTDTSARFPPSIQAMLLTLCQSPFYPPNLPPPDQMTVSEFFMLSLLSSSSTSTHQHSNTQSTFVLSFILVYQTSSFHLFSSHSRRPPLPSFSFELEHCERVQTEQTAEVTITVEF